MGYIHTRPQIGIEKKRIQNKGENARKKKEIVQEYKKELRDFRACVPPRQ